MESQESKKTVVISVINKGFLMLVCLSDRLCNPNGVFIANIEKIFQVFKTFDLFLEAVIVQLEKLLNSTNYEIFKQ